MPKKKLTVKLTCTYGKENPGAVVSIDEKLGMEMIDQGMAIKYVEETPTVSAPVSDLEKALADEKAKAETLEKAIAAYKETIETLEGRIEMGGQGFDLLVDSICNLDPKSEDLAVEVEKLQKSLGDPEGGKGSSKNSKKK